jgi:hypothetical protein
VRGHALFENAMQRINSVDGFHGALEIGYRSAYVPNSLASDRGIPAMRPEMPIWMK